MSVSKSDKGRGSNWTYGETAALLAIWGRANVQASFDGSVRDQKTYIHISKEMTESGHDRNPIQIKYKIKKMKKDYRACRDHNNRSGNNRKTIEHMDELDAILGHRPSVSPRVMLQSMAQPQGQAQAQSDTAANGNASDTASDIVDSSDDANDEDNRDAGPMVGRRDSPEADTVTPARRIKRPLVTYVSMSDTEGEEEYEATPRKIRGWYLCCDKTIIFKQLLLPLIIK